MQKSSCGQLASVMVSVGGDNAAAFVYPHGQHIAVGSADGSLQVIDAAKLLTEDRAGAAMPVKELSQHRDGILAIASSRSGDWIAMASADTRASLFDSKDYEFSFCNEGKGLAARAVALSHDGKVWAIGDDSGSVLQLATLKPEDRTEFPGHNAAVKSVAYDPRGEFLASASLDGVLHVWNVVTREAAAKDLAPFPRLTQVDTGQRYGMAWSPDGQRLAVAGANDVRFVTRDSWQLDASPDSRLTNKHNAAVSLLSWSSNGRWLASVDTSGHVVVWDVAARTAVATADLPGSAVSSLDWNPNSDTLMLINEAGSLFVWHKLLPLADGAATSAAAAMPGAEIGDEDDTMDEDQMLAMMNEVEGETQQQQQQQRSFERFGEDDVDGPIDDLEAEEDDQGSDGGNDDDGIDAGDEEDGEAARERMRARLAAAAQPLFRPQAPFQPTATQDLEETKRFLVWNAVGYITLREEETGNVIEVNFHDSANNRAHRMHQSPQTTLASLSETGYVLGTRLVPADDDGADETPAEIRYVSFDGWGTGSDWEFPLGPTEDALVVACGSNWAAVATSMQYVRVFSRSGVQLAVTSLPGAIVSMVGQGDELMLVTHAAAPAAPKQQSLAFSVWNVASMTQTAAGAVALTPRPDTQLTWIGFDDSGAPATADSEGIVRVFAAGHFGGTWMPLLDFEDEKVNNDDRLWVIGLTTESLSGVVLKAHESAPSPVTLPVPSEFRLAAPLLSKRRDRDSDLAKLLQQFIRRSMLVRALSAQLRAPRNAPHLFSDEDELLDAEISEEERKLDAVIVQLFMQASRANRIDRAVDLAELLALEKSLGIAITLANKQRKPDLAEQLNVLMERRVEERELREDAAAAAAPLRRAAFPGRFADDDADVSPSPQRSRRVPTSGDRGRRYLDERDGDDEDRIEETQDLHRDEDDEEATQPPIQQPSSAGSTLAYNDSHAAYSRGGAVSNPFATPAAARVPGSSSAGAKDVLSRLGSPIVLKSTPMAVSPSGKRKVPMLDVAEQPKAKKSRNLFSRIFSG